MGKHLNSVRVNAYRIETCWEQGSTGTHDFKATSFPMDCESRIDSGWVWLHIGAHGDDGSAVMIMRRPMLTSVYSRTNSIV